MENKLNKIEIERNEEEKGASMLEYTLLAALISVVAIAAMSFVGTQVSQTFSGVGGQLQDANANLN